MNFASLKKLSADLRRLPKVVAQKVAASSADAISGLAVQSFRASQDPYGNEWAPSAEGDRVTLVETGALARFLRYVATGTKLRVALGVPYAKYQIGKRPVFPRQGGLLPKAYTDTLAKASAEVISKEVEP